MKNRTALVIGIFVLLIFAVCGFLLFSCLSNHTYSNQTLSSEPTPFPTIAGIPTTYVGILPCADCSGLKMQLTLYRENPSQDSGQYDVKNIYLGTKGQIRYLKGKWKTIKGIKANPNATVYELNPENSADTRYFLKVDDKKIKMLNKQLAEIKSNLNYTLTEQ